jgi:hypothetical protein
VANDLIVKLLDLIAGVAVAATLVALPFSFYRFRRRPIRSALLVAIPVLVALAAGDTSQRIAQANVLDELDALSATSQVSIEAIPATNATEVLSSLKSLRWLPAHHSSPTKSFNIEISDGTRRILLWAARDSQNPREYWIFDPRNQITRHNPIGRIVTSAFDNYGK